MAGENINRRLNIYINDREVVNSMRGVTSEMSRVRNEIRNLNRGAADYDQRLEHLRGTYSRLQAEQARFRADLAQTPGILGRIRNALGPVAAGMLSAFSITAVVSVLQTRCVRLQGSLLILTRSKQISLPLCRNHVFRLPDLHLML